MTSWMLWSFVFCHLNWIICHAQPTTQPNIIFMVADDLGWNDVGWNNPDIITPNLDTLAKDGLILRSAYTQNLCSPSRAAFLTGYYPFRIGLQHGVLKTDRPNGLSLNVTLLPEKLRELGYSTHIVGKWHLGFCKWEYTPTMRGFDTFYGFYSGHINYFTHKTSKGEGLDFRLNEKVLREPTGKYSTNLFARRASTLIAKHNTKQPMFLYLPFQNAHTPFMVPRKYLDMYSHISNKDRQIFSAMVTALDDGVGMIMKALVDKGMYDNTLIVFVSDNGANPFTGGSNWPLRGGKGTFWEGAVRTPAFVWGSMVRYRGHISSEIIHAVDWYSTLLTAAGGKPDPDVDGVNQLPMLLNKDRSSRRDFVYGLNTVTGRSAIRGGKYKLIVGDPGPWNNWYPLSRSKRRKPKYLKGSNLNGNQTLLYNVEDDISESFDLSWKLPHIVENLWNRLKSYQKLVVPIEHQKKTAKSNPKFWGGVWSPGWC